MRKLLALLALPLIMALAACDTPPPGDGVAPADRDVTTPLQ